MHKTSLTLLALAGALCLSTGLARAESDTLSPLQHRLQAKLAKKQPARPGGQQQAVDHKAPEVLGLAIADPRVAVGNPLHGTLDVKVVTNDNISGVRQVWIAAQDAANGYWASGSVYLSMPQKRPTLVVPLGFGGDAPQGQWRLTEMQINDAEGNSTYYDEAALAAMGATSFTVSNDTRTDQVAPTVTSGQILTPTVSRSGTPKGRSPGSYNEAYISLQAEDTGLQAVSGLNWAYASLCTANFENCISLSGQALRQGAKTSAIGLGTQVYTWATNGIYQLYSLQIVDRLGNWRYYSADDTDFNAMFGGTTSITITD